MWLQAECSDFFSLIGQGCVDSQNDWFPCISYVLQNKTSESKVKFISKGKLTIVMTMSLLLCLKEGQWNLAGLPTHLNRVRKCFYRGLFLKDETVTKGKKNCTQQRIKSSDSSEDKLHTGGFPMIIESKYSFKKNLYIYSFWLT